MGTNGQNYDGIPVDAEKRKFTGIWIPAEIWEDENIPALSKMLYAEIASFGSRGCWKKSEELMRPLGVSRSLFQQLCRALREHGYITEQRMFGRIVRTTALAFRPSSGMTHQCEKQAVHQAVSQADEQAVSQVVQKEYTKEYTKNKGGDNAAEGVENSKKEFGRADVNELAELWESETGISIKGQQTERRQLYNLLRKYGHEATKTLVKRVGATRRSRDRYAPQIAVPSDLTGKYSKLPRMQMWEERNKASRSFGQPANPTLAAIKGNEGWNAGAWEEPSDEERERVRQMFKQKRDELFG